MHELRARIYGRVQMVMFRDFTQRTAKKLHLTGEVHNEPDGSVSVIAQGQQDALQNLLGRLHHGSLFSRVDRVDVQWLEQPTQSFSKFSIRY